MDYTKQGETAGYNYKKANLDANKKAIENVRNLEAEDTNSEYTLEKQKKVYKESYQSTYEQEEKEINSLKNMIKKILIMKSKVMNIIVNIKIIKSMMF